MTYSPTPWNINTREETAPNGEIYTVYYLLDNKGSHITDIYSHVPISDKDNAERIAECVNLFHNIENSTKYLEELKEKAWMYDELNK